MRVLAASISALLLGTAPALAAGAGAPHLDGAELGLIWCVPFAGILLSIALFPLLAPNFWHHHFGKISAFWALAFLLPFLGIFGWELALFETLHVALLEYIPFIILLLSLFTVAGGIRLTGRLVGTPVVNTAILLLGTVLASWMGTTGAAMLLIRPIIRANEWRRYKVHTMVFFIFLVANIGGSLTPLGDPPLFLGFLKGVDFFWPTGAMLVPMLVVSVILLVLYYGVDSFFYRRETGGPAEEDEGDGESLGVTGTANFLLLAGIVAAVLMSGVWRPHISFDVYHVHVELQNLCRDLALLAIAWASWIVTDPGQPRRQRLLLVPDPGGRQALRRHLPHHRAGHRHPEGRHFGCAGAGGLAGHGRGRPAGRGDVFLADRHPVELPRQMRPHISCSSTPPAATPRN